MALMHGKSVTVINSAKTTREKSMNESRMSLEQQRYHKLLEDWKNCKTETSFKDYVLACGYTEKQYNQMTLKHS
jgi:hypothetical protein